MTPKLWNLRKKFRERLILAAVGQDILNLMEEIEKETDDLLAKSKPSR